MAVAFANLFMAEIETKILINPKAWKRYIDDVFSPWDVNRQDINLFIEQANTIHSTIPLATHQVLREALFEEKQSDFLDQTPRKKFPGLRPCVTSKHDLKHVVITRVSFAGRQSALKKQTKNSPVSNSP